MPKFFVTSDVHGYYDEMKNALDNAGFDPENEEHWIVVCGDLWDRGSQPVEVMRYLQGFTGFHFKVRQRFFAIKYCIFSQL